MEVVAVDGEGAEEGKHSRALTALWVKRLVSAFAADLGEKIAGLVLLFWFSLLSSFLDLWAGVLGSGFAAVASESGEELSLLVSVDEAAACNGEKETVNPFVSLPAGFATEDVNEALTSLCLMS